MAECRPQNYPKLKDYKPSRFMLRPAITMPQKQTGQ